MVVNEKEDPLGRTREWPRRSRQRSASGLVVSWGGTSDRQPANQPDSFEDWKSSKLPFNNGKNLLQLGMVGIKRSKINSKITGNPGYKYPIHSSEMPL